MRKYSKISCFILNDNNKWMMLCGWKLPWMISNTTIARCCTVHQICRTGHYVVRDTRDWILKICRAGHIWLNTVRGNRGGHVPYDILCRTGQICSLRHNVPYDIFHALYNISQWWCLRSLMTFFNHITSSIYYYPLI